MNRESVIEQKFWSLIKKVGKTNSKINPYKRLDRDMSSKKHGDGVGVLPPKGCIFLYVGTTEQQNKYQVPLKYLSSPTLQKLIAKSQPDVFDAKIDGPIVLSCSTADFHRLMIKIAGDCNN